MKNRLACHELVGIQPCCEILLKVEKIINGFKHKKYGVYKNSIFCLINYNFFMVMHESL